MAYDLSMRVWRGDSSGGVLQDFTVSVEEEEVVLDALFKVQAEQVGDLAIRWNCKAGKCGSCSAEINGRPRLMCMTRLNVFDPSETITVTPLRTFPLIKDLVTDVSFNYEMAKKVPAFAPQPREADGTYRMMQTDVERGQEFRKCIECWLCQDTCHVIRDHEENKPAFAGPRFFIRYAELEMHPLDTNDRRQLVQDQMGLGLCNITKCCTEVCPENIKITDNGIIPLKERVVDRQYDPLVWLGSRISRRDRREASADDSGTAEESARQQVTSSPKDRAGHLALAESLGAQGRWKEASESSRQAVATRSRTKGSQLSALSTHAWTLLCAVEAGQLPADPYADQAADALRQAQRLASTGTVLAGHHALLAAVTGRYADGERQANEALSWDRPKRERADSLLTLARSLAGSGRREEAAQALEESRALWPDNPRIAGVERHLHSPVTAD